MSANGSGSDVSLNDRTAIKRSRGRPRRIPSDVAIDGAEYSVPNLSRAKPSNGVRHRQHNEKELTLDDAIFIYKKLRRSEERLPVFLQRNLTYRLIRSTSKIRKITLNDVLSKMKPSQSNQVTIELEKIIKIPNSAEAVSLTLDVFLQKKCFKRRKTDVSVSEKHLGKYNLDKSALNGEEAIHEVTFDIGELETGIGNSYLDSCYLKYRLIVVREKKAKTAPVANKRIRNAAHLVTESKYRTKEYTALLPLLSSSNTLSIPSGLHVLFLQVANKEASPSQTTTGSPSTKPSLHLKVIGVSADAKPSAPPSVFNTETAPALEVQDDVIEDGESKIYMTLNYRGNPKTLKQNNFNCPLCKLRVYPQEAVFLLKHLRLCHSRLNFVYRESERVIDVSVNKYYEGGYSSNPLSLTPHHKQSHLESIKSKVRQPMRRNPGTEVINFRVNRKPVSIEEFTKLHSTAHIHALNSFDRLYFHSVNNQPIMSGEFSDDSDGDEFLLTSTRSNKLIDEFIDINRGEKYLIKLWNTFMYKNTQYISDCQMVEACEKFIKDNAVVLIQYRNNLMCHMCTLYDCAILNPHQMARIVAYINKIFGNSSTNSD